MMPIATHPTTTPANRGIESYFANETETPLTDAFTDMSTVHPGGKTAPVPRDAMANTWDELLTTEREGKAAAYIHVPFCESHCLYCGFYRKRYDAAQSKSYTDALIQELRMSADSKLQSSAPIHAVYVGGGTPTSLEAPDLLRLLEAVRENLPLANDCEITIEGRIHNFGPEKMEACLTGGANRFSLGVQTFDTALRQSMKRLADRDTVLESLARLKSYDQAAIVIDLIYGFPNQTMEMWEKDIRTLLSLELDGVDLYQLKTFPGTPLHGAIERGKFPEGPDRKARALMYERGVQMMDDAQYKRLSVNHWGRTSRERNIYNHMMKSPAHCLPFGPGAGGGVQNHFLFLESDYDTWRDAVMQENRKPIAMMQKGKPHATLEKTITSEMELCRINLPRLEKAFHMPLTKTLTPLYDQWTRVGLMTSRGDWNILTTAGQFWQVHMAQLTISYLNDTIFKE